MGWHYSGCYLQVFVCVALAAVPPTASFEASAFLGEQVEHGYPESCEVPSLLQLGRTSRGATHAEATQRKGKCHERLAWFHVPKAGTSLGNTLFRFANESLPPSAALPDASQMELRFNASLVDAFLQDYPIDTWFQECFWLRQGLPSTHQGITDEAYEEFEGEFVGMFREPKARAYSSYTYFGGFPGAHMTQAEYAARIRGLVTKMLTGQGESSSGYGYGANCSLLYQTIPCDRSEPDLELALKRLDGFKFIGLTEHWNLSICLFHKMLGGKFSEIELENVRPSTSSANTTAESAWNYTDPADSAVYGKASEIFWSNVLKYNLTEESCTAMRTSTQ